MIRSIVRCRLPPAYHAAARMRAKVQKILHVGLKPRGLTSLRRGIYVKAVSNHHPLITWTTFPNRAKTETRRKQSCASNALPPLLLEEYQTLHVETRL